MTVQIPHEYSSKFEVFFKGFDSELARLQIRSYGVSITTLEEVFMKVGHLEDPAQVSLAQIEPVKVTDLETQSMKFDGFNLKDNQKDLDESFLNNLLGIVYQRFSNYRRNKKAIFNEAILPAIIMVVGVSVATIAKSN
jgi:hypothetical protein